MAFEQIGQQFVAYYYSKFDVCDGSTRQVGLADLYDTENSILSFEGNPFIGKVKILEKFSSLTFRCISRKITKIDCQPLAHDCSSILVTVFGQLQTDEDRPQSYVQTFVLRQTPNFTSYFIANEIFRLIIHDM